MTELHAAADPAQERRRWTLTVLVAVLVSIGCVAAGVWQWTRHTERSAAVSVVEANFGAPVVDIAAVVDRDTPLPADTVWQPVAATGRYVGEPVLLRNRPVAGRPALHVLQPFALEGGALDGAVLVVDRGWIPSEEEADGVAAPTGTVEVVVRLRQEEESSGRDAPAGQVQEIVVAQVRDASGAPPEWPPGAALELYGGLVTEDGAPAVGLGRLPTPQTSLGTNLSYAFQWWVFALGALLAPVILLRKERRDAAEAAEEALSQESPHGEHEQAGSSPAGPGSPGRSRAARATAPRRRRRPTAEEEEDALLDAQMVPRREGARGEPTDPGRQDVRGPGAGPRTSVPQARDSRRA